MQGPALTGEALEGGAGLVGLKPALLDPFHNKGAAAPMGEITLCSIGFLYWPPAWWPTTV